MSSASTVDNSVATDFSRNAACNIAEFCRYSLTEWDPYVNENGVTRWKAVFKDAGIHENAEQIWRCARDKTFFVQCGATHFRISVTYLVLVDVLSPMISMRTYGRDYGDDPVMLYEDDEVPLYLSFEVKYTMIGCNACCVSNVFRCFV
jgi:hypothetical protein